MRLTLIISLLCLVSYLPAQQKDSRQAIEDALGQYKDLDTDPQLLLLERSLQKSEANYGKNDTTTAKVYRSLAIWYQNNADFDEALSYSKKYLESIQNLNLNSHSIAKAHILTAESYMELYDFEKAEAHFRKSIKLNTAKKRGIAFENYKGLATVHASKGNFNLQIEHGKYAYDLAESPAEKCEALHTQFKGHARMRQTQRCSELVEQQLQIAKQNNLAFHRGNAYTNLGRLHKIKADNYRFNKKSDLSKVEYRKAINYYNKGVSYIKNSGHPDERRTISWAYKNISNQYKRLGKLDLSTQYVKLAIQENKAFFGKEYYPELADFYHNLASNYTLLAKYSGPEDFEAGLRYFQNAIKCLLQDESFSDVRATIPKEKLYKVSIKWQMLWELREKSLCYAYLYLKHHNTEDMESAERHLANAVELIDIMRAELSTNDTKVFWKRKTRFIYNTAIEVSEWLGDDEKVLKYMEKSKSLLLLDELNNKDAKTLIPPHLAQREKNLRDAFVDAQENDVLKYDAFNTFLDSLKQAYPSYYKYKFDVKTPSIKEVQENILDDSTQVLSYHITPDSLYLLNITKNASQVITSPKPKKLKSKVDRILNLLNNKDSLEYAHNFEEFVSTSKDVHDLLMSGVSQEIPKVIVVGDGVINFVPFDVLVSEIREGTPSYLIEKFSFSTAPSLSVLQKYEGDKSFNKLLMISPGSFKNSDLIPLVRSEKEVEELKRISNAFLLDEERATLQNFVDVCNDFDVIHFSTHSGIDKKTSEPWIAFQDSLISLNEIYKLNLKASLVTLSSCKSYDGIEESGEGINSLSRAFLFADAASVVGSMWNLNEAAGNQILVDFYNGLKNKKDKSTSLRDAKLAYIKSNNYKSPYYWSSLVLMGDPDSLDSSPQKSGFNIALLGIIFISFLLLFYYAKLRS